MMTGWRMGALALVLVAGPALAQAGRGPMADLFAGMSPEGRRVLSGAMLETRSDPMREASRSARERVLQILEADPLDRRALAEAMKTEDDLLVTQLNERRQRMLAAYGQLSAADRKAFVAANRAQMAKGPPGRAPRP